MKKISRKEQQRFAFSLAVNEYLEAIEYRQSEEYRIALSCDMKPVDEMFKFIEQLLLRCFPITDKDMVEQVVDFAKTADSQGDTFILEILLSQIDKCNIANIDDRNWAKKKLKEIY